MDVSSALRLLEDAVKRSLTENVQTAEVLAALKFLEGQTENRWPFEQFRKVLAPREGEIDLDKVGRSQVLNASFNGIRRALGTNIAGH